MTWGIFNWWKTSWAHSATWGDAFWCLEMLFKSLFFFLNLKFIYLFFFPLPRGLTWNCKRCCALLQAYRVDVDLLVKVHMSVLQFFTFPPLLLLVAASACCYLWNKYNILSVSRAHFSQTSKPLWGEVVGKNELGCRWHHFYAHLLKCHVNL